VERLGVRTLIFLIAIMDFGHIAPGFAQIERYRPDSCKNAL